MADVPHVQPKDFFKLFAPTYVLGTTYTLSLAFFEGIVYPEIKRLNLRRCMILCDKVGFQRATIESSALRSVGREYMAICAPARRSFHPKVWVMIAEGKTALLVGSGNLTQSGFMDNTELFEVVQLEAGGPHHAVVDDIVRFLAGLRSMWSENARRLLAIETLEEMERELTDLGRQMPDDPAPDLRFMSNFDRPLIEQFKDLFRGGTLQVAAPYFGGTTQGIRLLQEQLAPNKIRVFPAVHPRNELDIGLSDLKTMTGVSVSLLRIAGGGPFDTSNSMVSIVKEASGCLRRAPIAQSPPWVRRTWRPAFCDESTAPSWTNILLRHSTSRSHTRSAPTSSLAEQDG
jgi:hypothetical protein